MMHFECQISLKAECSRLTGFIKRKEIVCYKLISIKITQPMFGQLNGQYLELPDYQSDSSQTIDTMYNTEKHKLLDKIAMICECFYQEDQTNLAQKVKKAMQTVFFKDQIIEDVPGFLMKLLNQELGWLNQEPNIFNSERTLLKDKILTLCFIMNSHLHSIGKKKIMLSNEGYSLVSFLLTKNFSERFEIFLFNNFSFSLEQKLHSVRELIQEYFKDVKINFQKVNQHYNLENVLSQYQRRLEPKQQSLISQLTFHKLKIDPHLKHTRMEFMAAIIYEEEISLQSFYASSMILSCPPKLENLFEESRRLMNCIIQNSGNQITGLYLEFASEYKKNTLQEIEIEITVQKVRKILIDGINFSSPILWPRDFYGILSNSGKIYCNALAIVKLIHQQHNISDFERERPLQLDHLVMSTFCLILFHQLAHYLLRELGLVKYARKSFHELSEDVKNYRRTCVRFFRQSQQKSKLKFFKENLHILTKFSDKIKKEAYFESLNKELNQIFSCITKCQMSKLLKTYCNKTTLQQIRKSQLKLNKTSLPQQVMKNTLTFSKFIQIYASEDQELKLQFQALQLVTDWEYKAFNYFNDLRSFSTLVDFSKVQQVEFINSNEDLNKKLNEIKLSSAQLDNEIEEIFGSIGLFQKMLEIVPSLYLGQTVEKLLIWSKMQGYIRDNINTKLKRGTKLIYLQAFIRDFRRHYLKQWVNLQLQESGQIVVMKIFPKFSNTIYSTDLEILERLAKKKSTYNPFESLRKSFGVKNKIQKQAGQKHQPIWIFLEQIDKTLY